MKPNSQSGISGAGRQDRDASLLSAQLTDVSGSLESNTPVQELGSQYVEPPRRHGRTFGRALSLTILGVGILGAVLLALHEAQANKQTALNANQAVGSALIKAQVIPLNNLGLQQLATLPQTNALTVNGDVNITGSVLLSPTTPPPAGAVAGQLYFDSVKNQVGYYNGSGYVYLQGGSASVTNNVTNLTKVTTVTDAITNQYVTTGITAINGTAGNLAMFDGIGGLTESLIAQSGNNLNTGTGVENVTIGSSSGASTTIVQGGTGNVAINTGDTTGSSGSITIQSGASSTTAAGNVTIDTGGSIITGTLIADKTFEDGIDNMGDATYGDNSSITQSNAEAHGGTHSLAVAVGSNFFPSWSVGDGGQSPPYIIPVSPGHSYAFTAWVRAGTNSDLITASVIWSSDGYAGGGEISQQNFGSVTDVSTGWKQVAGVLTAPAGASSMGFLFSSNNAASVGEVHYFDDISVTDLSSSASDAALNLGATNAQIITIGNSGMLAPTTIYGGGVNINGGTGFVNVSGSNLNATSGGATYSTTSGALDITAATSSTWKIGGSNFGGGNLNIQAGDAGGNNNGGNLILQSGVGAGTGVSGAVQVNTPSASSTTGTITIQSGDSSTTAAGDVNIDTGNSTITGTQVDNLTFETGTDGMNFWGGSGTATQDCTQAHSGVCSLNITGTSGASTWEYGGDYGWSVTPGHTYAFSFWVKAASTVEPVSGAVSWGMTGGGWTWAYSPTITDVNTGWTQVTWTATAPAGAQYGDFELGNISGPGTTHYFDDVVATDMSSGSAFSSLNLGTANAQGVNIGNISQINATTIDGGGITLAAGQGNLNISGGATTVTAAGPATIKSTGGALTLSGAGGSGDGVIVKPQADSVTAFQVQNSSGSSLLNVDSADSIVSLGTNVTTMGYPKVASSQNTGNSDWLEAQKVTTTGGGSLKAITVYFGSVDSAPNNQFAVALYSDSGTACNGGVALTSCPASMIASSANTTISPFSWNSATINAILAPNTTYWMVMSTYASAGGLNNTYSNTNNAYDYASDSGVAFGSWPAFGAPTFTAHSTISMYASVVTGSDGSSLTTSASGDVVVGGGTAKPAYSLTVNSPGTGTGALYVQGTMSIDAVNPYAFQMSDSGGGELFDIDSQNNRVLIGALDTHWGGAYTAGTLDVRAEAHLGLISGTDAGGNAIFSVDGTGDTQITTSTDSTTAFNVQNALQGSVFSVDTVSSIVTAANFVATGTLTVGGHIITNGTTPTYTADAAACTTPSITVSGNDTSGTVTVRAGSACTSGNMVTVNFASKFGTNPHVVITPGSSLTSGLNAYVDDSTISTSGFAIGTSATPVSGDIYTWNYFVVQ
jgi:hypothetical protein